MAANYSIVTGNGFTGNAQRCLGIAVLSKMVNTGYTFSTGTYSLNFKYRCNARIAAYIGSSYSSDLIDTKYPNIGNANTASYYNITGVNGKQLGFSIRSSDGTSANSITIPTSHPTTVTLTTQTGLDYLAGGAGVQIMNNAHTAWFYGTVNSYVFGSGALSVNSTSNTGTGTFSSWEISTDLTTAWFEVDEVNVYP